MKLWLLSDLHVDVNRRYPFILPHPLPEHDAVVIAGDLCEGIVNGVHWIAENGLNAKPVIYVPGNHEFYQRDIEQEIADGIAESLKHWGIHILDDSGLVITGPAGERVRFDGATLWTDYNYFGTKTTVTKAMLAAASGMNDHRLIRMGERIFQPENARRLFDESSGWLQTITQLAAEWKANGTIDAHVIVTHHGISKKSVADRYKGNLLTAAFVSKLDQLVSKADMWVHGHVHNQTRYRIGRCEVVVNPRGYVRLREDVDFNPRLVVEVGKRRRRSARQRNVEAVG